MNIPEIPGVSVEDMAVFASVAHAIVELMDGAADMTLIRICEETGEMREIHVHLHNSVICEMLKLDFLDRQVGGGDEEAS